MNCRLALAVVAVAATGCTSFSSFQTARPLRPRTVQLTPAIGGQGFIDPAATSSTPTQLSYPAIDYAMTRTPFPLVDVEARFGVHERADLGVRLGLSGLELSGKVLLTPPEWKLVAVALAPSVRGRLQLTNTGGFSFGSVELADFSLPLLVEVDPIEPLQLVAGLKALFTVFGGARSGQTLSLGGSLGAGYWFNPRFGLLLEADLFRPVYGYQPQTNPLQPRAPAPWLLQGGLAFRIRLGRAADLGIEVPPPPPEEVAPAPASGLPLTPGPEVVPVPL